VKFFNKHLGVNKIADKLVGRLEQFEKLKEIANRKNYPHKIKLLEEKIEEQHTFWKRKDHSQRLLDLEKDLTFIRSQKQECSLDKQRIDLLIEKYGYGKSN
jgi:hypothetical protein